MPVCFVADGATVYTAVDEKPKRTRKLKRLRNVEQNPHVELLVDHYDEDWSKLWWVRVRGTARVTGSARALDLLAAKYAQYRERPPAGPVIEIRVEQVSEWHP